MPLLLRCLTGFWFLASLLAAGPVLAQGGEILAPARTASAAPSPAAQPPNTLNLDTLNTPQSETPAIDPKDIPDILMSEVNEVERNCNANAFYSAYHDCRCIAVKYLDARLNSDPGRSGDAIFQKVASLCPNEPGIAGFVYKSCTDVMKYSRPEDYDKFCKCSANQVAIAYTKRPLMNMRYIENLRRDAFVSCGIGNDPANNSRYLDQKQR